MRWLRRGWRSLGTVAFGLVLVGAACGGSDAGPTSTLQSNSGSSGTAASVQTAPQDSTDSTEGGGVDLNIDRSDLVVPKTESSVAPPAPGSGVVEPSLSSIVEVAVDDLASRLGVEVAHIAVDTAEFVVWPDSSLGCPQPGMSYTQVQTDGSRIILVQAGVRYAYHTGGTVSVPFLCE